MKCTARLCVRGFHKSGLLVFIGFEFFGQSYDPEHGPG